MSGHRHQTRRHLDTLHRMHRSRCLETMPAAADAAESENRPQGAVSVVRRNGSTANAVQRVRLGWLGGEGLGVAALCHRHRRACRIDRAAPASGTHGAQDTKTERGKPRQIWGVCCWGRCPQRRVKPYALRVLAPPTPTARVPPKKVASNFVRLDALPPAFATWQGFRRLPEPCF